MAWHQKNVKLLPEILLTETYDAIWRHYVTMNSWTMNCLINIISIWPCKNYKPSSRCNRFSYDLSVESTIWPVDAYMQRAVQTLVQVMAWRLSGTTLRWRHNGRDGVSTLRHRLKTHQSSASLAFVRGTHWWPVANGYQICLIEMKILEFIKSYHWFTA